MTTLIVAGVFTALILATIGFAWQRSRILDTDTDPGYWVHPDWTLSTARTVTVTINADTSAFEAALRKAAKAAAKVSLTLSGLQHWYDRQIIKVYVQGGLADLTEHADPAVRDAYVRDLARLHPELAASFIRGYVEAHPEPREVFTFHRHLGGVGDVVTVLA